MNEILPKAPSLVDMDKLGAELEPTSVPAEVARFAPSKYRATTTLSQTTSDLRKVISDMQRAHDEYALKMKAHWDELLRIIG
jgi:hypothetical protein